MVVVVVLSVAAAALEVSQRRSRHAAPDGARPAPAAVQPGDAPMAPAAPAPPASPGRNAERVG